MTADIYHDLHEFDSSIHQALRSLKSITRSRSFAKKEVSRFGDLLREVRSAANSYIVGVIETHETDEAGSLFKRRRKWEKAESA